MNHDELSAAVEEGVLRAASKIALLLIIVAAIAEFIRSYPTLFWWGIGALVAGALVWSVVKSARDRLYPLISVRAQRAITSAFGWGIGAAALCVVGYFFDKSKDTPVETAANAVIVIVVGSVIGVVRSLRSRDPSDEAAKPSLGAE